MNSTAYSWLSVSVAAIVLSVLARTWAAEISDNLLTNPSFEQGVGERGLPLGWSLYGGGGQDQAIELVEPGRKGAKAVLIRDGDPTKEIGLMQTLPVEPGLTYQASVSVKGIEGASSFGAYLQLRFLPSNKYAQCGLAATSTEAFEELSAKAIAPPDTTHARIYVYTHRDPTPTLIVDEVKLVSGVEPPPPPPPEPVPPVYTELKDLHITTELVRGGKPNVTIVAPQSGTYDAEARRIQAVIQRLTGAKAPIASDDAPEAAVPIRGNLIALGNRSTNKTIEELYNRYYTLLDLRYPGPGGYVVRTLHNPFGDGRNVIFVGGSDAAGVRAAAQVLTDRLQAAGGKDGTLSVGRLAEIRLGKGIRVPKELKDFETWEASAGYGSVGYFGWNSLSKRLAMYYMTGDDFHAREFIRLAFPDEEAKREIAEIDGERIENKDEPLGGPYHYNAHMMILFWDLVEESPVFTDEERLRVTNAFSRQLNHRKGEGIYGRVEPPPHVGSRHGQWSAISLYCLGRYFQKDYPNPIWQHCIAAAKLHFAPLHEHAWVSGESDNLFWYNTATAPILTYLCLTGDRGPVKNGVLARLLRAQEMLISGRQPDWALRSASIGYLHKAAYLTGDGRWLTYRERT
ncbi:MAG: carbohydrate binding domain-containing protein, partial [Armatimonadota bacterium]